MAMSITTEISHNGQRDIGITQTQLDRSVKRLKDGHRVTQLADSQGYDMNSRGAELSDALQTRSNSSRGLERSYSRIADRQVAEDTAEMTRSQIMDQAGMAVLAQANQLPQAAMSLIG